MNLEFHKRKMRQLQEELISAEVWEMKLEERTRKIQEKPPFVTSWMDKEVVEASLVRDDWEKVVNYITKRVVMVEQMDRSQLVGLVRTVLRVRNCLVER